MADDPVDPIDEHENDEDRAGTPRIWSGVPGQLRAGVLMLVPAPGGLRVREVMSAVAWSVGIEQLDAQVTFTQTLTVGRCGLFRTQVGETWPG